MERPQLEPKKVFGFFVVLFFFFLRFSGWRLLKSQDVTLVKYYQRSCKYFVCVYARM